MKTKATVLSVLILTGALIWSSAPVGADTFVYKQRFGETNYCHMKFPAIREDTLSGDNPVLKDPSTNDIIDFYGPCDYDPKGKDAVQSQRADEAKQIRQAL